MVLIDEAKIKVQAGSGGNGCVSFRREKYVPRGGPNGGNGGNGGSVYLQATLDKSSLLDFKYRPLFRAVRGQHGMGSDMDGRAGGDLVIAVPVGTMVLDHYTNSLIADLTTPDELVLIAKGGRGGRGNMTFATSTNRAPIMATPGEPGQTAELRLELRLISDVGLIGLPNAGKSTLLSAISRARPKIADYPFTTLEPHLGVVYHRDQSFVVADLPGLINGASAGAGLGHRFLKHVTRNRILLHLVDSSPSTREIAENIEIIRREIRDFDSSLDSRREMLVMTKTDLATTESVRAKKSELERTGHKGLWISSHSGFGINNLLDCILNEIKAQPIIRPHDETTNESTSL